MTLPALSSQSALPTLVLDPSDIVSSLGTTLLHSTWQIALIGLVFAIASRTCKTPATRHSLGMLCLIAAVAWPAYTFSAERKATFQDTPSLQAATALDLTVTEENASDESGVAAPIVPSSAMTAPLLETLRFSFGLLWLLGTTLLLIRLALGLGYLRSVRRRASSDQQLATATGKIEQRVHHLTQRMGLSKRLSQRIDLQVVHEQLGPCTFGLLRASVLLPLSAVSGLPPSQLDAILLHELCHVRRHDAWFATLQAVLDCALFFHPVALWISSEVTRAREDACDDLVLASSSPGNATSRTSYAEALLSLAKLRQHLPAVAAQGSNLQRRVRRIVGLEEHSSSRFRALPSSAIPSALLVLMVAGSAALFGLGLGAPNEETMTVQPPVQVMLHAQIVMFDDGILDEDLGLNRLTREPEFQGTYLNNDAEVELARLHILETLSAPTIVTLTGSPATMATQLREPARPSQDLQLRLELSILPKFATNSVVLADVALTMNLLDESLDQVGTVDDNLQRHLEVQLSDYILQKDAPFLFLEAAPPADGTSRIGIFLHVKPTDNGRASLQLGEPEPMTLTIKDADFLNVVETITRYAEVDLAIAPSAEPHLDTPITMQAIAVPHAPLLELILHMACLEGSVHGNVLEVTELTSCEMVPLHEQ